MSRPHWIVTDLDGTLVDRTLRIPARNRAAVRRFRAAGGRVVFATGRSGGSLRPYYRELALDGPAITLNGARVVDPRTGRVLLDRYVEGAAWAALRERLNGLCTVAFVGDVPYSTHPEPPLRAYAERDRIAIRPIASWDRLPRVSKCLIVARAGGVPALAADLGARLPELTVVESERTYLEVLPPGTNKGSALRWLAQRCGVPLADVAAIGDNPNDLDMIRVAGLGVAVGDGHPDVRARADLVVGRCADGAVGDLVDHLLGPTDDPPPGPGGGNRHRALPAFNVADIARR